MILQTSQRCSWASNGRFVNIFVYTVFNDQKLLQTMWLQCPNCAEKLYDHTAYGQHLRDEHGVVRFVKQFLFENDEQFETTREIWRSTHSVQLVQRSRPWICGEYSAKMYHCSRCALMRELPKETIDDMGRIPAISKNPNRSALRSCRYRVFLYFEYSNVLRCLQVKKYRAGHVIVKCCLDHFGHKLGIHDFRFSAVEKQWLVDNLADHDGI